MAKTKKVETKIETPEMVEAPVMTGSTLPEGDPIKVQRLADCQELIRLMNEFGIAIEEKVYQILESLKK